MPSPDSPPTIDKLEGLDEYVALRGVFTSPLLTVRSWRCLHDGEALRRERVHAGPSLSIVDHGAFVLQADGEEHLIDPTSVVLTEAWAPYNTAHPFGCGDFGCHLQWRDDVVRSAMGDRDDARQSAIRRAIVSGPSNALVRLRLLLRRLRHALPVDPLDFEESALELLDEVIGRTPAHRPTTVRRAGTWRDHERLAEATRAVLVERFREPLKIDDVARAVHASPFHLSRIFRRVTGQSVHQYRNRLRLLESLETVAEPDTDLTALALELGFSSHSHFTASFRRLFDLTPTDFRRQAGVGGRP